ncbi:hypothetical protein CUJ83_07635 [Methanocella sp. CWC-04]|uniref:FemAB family protein n=2 Tax=Methanooceanicella nereidis TaxID=2052831 RepID=A0AAP2W609_9EURY|nr:hypothetical protein [Methanocella sp. CWC-04]
MFKRKDVWFSDHPFDVKGYDSVVFYSCKNNVDAEGFRRSETATLTMDLTQDLDTIWRDVFHSHCKKSINRAKKAGVKIKINEDYEKFVEVNRSFRKQKGLPDDFIDVDFLRSHGTLFVAEYEGDIIVGTHFLEDEGHIRSLIGASKRFEVDKKTARLISETDKLIDWEAMNYAKEKGINEFDFGGFYIGEEKNTDMENINSVKSGYGGKLTKKYNYEKNYSRIYDLSKKLYELKIKL